MAVDLRYTKGGDLGPYPICRKGKRAIEYVAWSLGDDMVTLDGSFTAAELHAIADHMEAHQKKEQEP